MPKKEAWSVFTQAKQEQEAKYTDAAANQSKDDMVMIGFRVSPELRAQIKVRAATLSISVTDYLQQLVEADLK